jgi:AraC-like DNA-binding protein
MEIILIIGVVEALFLLLLLVMKPRKRTSDRWLGLMFGLFALTQTGAWAELYNHHHGYPFPALTNVSWLLLMLHGPALWLYIKSVTQPLFRFKPVYLLHALPFLAFFAFHLYGFMLLPAAEKITLASTEAFVHQTDYLISVAGIAISALTYNILGLNMIRAYRRRLLQQFSRVDHIDLEWLRILIVATLVLYSVNVVLFNLNNIIRFAGYFELIQITYTFATVFIFVLGFFGLRQPEVFVIPQTTPTPLNQDPEIVSHETDTPGEPRSTFATNLLHHMEQEQPWLDPEITLGKLSSMLEVRPEFLSEVINRELNRNFFDFINHYRIEEFKAQVMRTDKRHFSILGLAYECGFNSKASFYRAFGKFEGLSPTQYMQQVSGTLT